MNILEFGSPQSSPFVLFFHGFPAIRSRQNRDIAEGVASVTGGCSEVLLYDGLGFAPGVFSFKECIAKVRQHLIGLRARGIEVFDLVGHSWGGFMALALAPWLAGEGGARLRRLTLMSPLLAFEEAGLNRATFEDAIRNNANIHVCNPDILEHELRELSRAYPPERLAAGLGEDVEVLFLQAKIDQLTPAEIAEATVAKFRSPPRFELVDTDHSFLLDRTQLTERIAAFIRDGKG